MTKLGKEFSVACNGKGLSTYRFPGADLVLFTKITSSPPKYKLLHQNIEFSTKITGSPPKYVGVCSSNSLATRRGTTNLIYILLLFFIIFLQLLLTLLLLYFSYSSLFTSSSIVAVLIAKAGRVWVSWPEEFLLYFVSLTLQQVCYCQRID